MGRGQGDVFNRHDGRRRASVRLTSFVAGGNLGILHVGIDSR